MFKYGDKVKVKDDFYNNPVGRIVGRIKNLGIEGNKYTVEMIFSGNTPYTDKVYNDYYKKDLKKVGKK